MGFEYQGLKVQGKLIFHPAALNIMQPNTAGRVPIAFAVQSCDTCKQSVEANSLSRGTCR